MHQMRISTTQDSSVIFGRKSRTSEKKIVKTVLEPKKNQILCHGIETNPSKDKAMHEGDNPSF